MNSPDGIPVGTWSEPHVLRMKRKAQSKTIKQLWPQSPSVRVKISDSESKDCILGFKFARGLKKN